MKSKIKVLVKGIRSDLEQSEEKGWPELVKLRIRNVPVGSDPEKGPFDIMANDVLVGKCQRTRKQEFEGTSPVPIGWREGWSWRWNKQGFEEMLGVGLSANDEDWDDRFHIMLKKKPAAKDVAEHLNKLAVKYKVNKVFQA